jgi:prophage regulatory protein
MSVNLAPKRNKIPKPSPSIYAQDIHLASRYSVTRATIWRWTAEGRIPQPIKLSPGCARWRIDDLESFESEISGTRHKGRKFVQRAKS